MRIYSIIVSVWILSISASVWATTHFVGARERPVALTVSGSTRVFMVDGQDESTGLLSYKTPTTDWTRLPMPTTPFQPARFDIGTGVVGVNVAQQTWGANAVFVVTPAAGANPAGIWTLSYD